MLLPELDIDKHMLEYVWRFDLTKPLKQLTKVDRSTDNLLYLPQLKGDQDDLFES